MGNHLTTSQRRLDDLAWTSRLSRRSLRVMRLNLRAVAAAHGSVDERDFTDACRAAGITDLDFIRDFFALFSEGETYFDYTEFSVYAALLGYADYSPSMSAIEEAFRAAKSYGAATGTRADLALSLDEASELFAAVARCIRRCKAMLPGGELAVSRGRVLSFVLTEEEEAWVREYAVELVERHPLHTPAEVSIARHHGDGPADGDAALHWHAVRGSGNKAGTRAAETTAPEEETKPTSKNGDDNNNSDSDSSSSSASPPPAKKRKRRIRGGGWGRSKKKDKKESDTPADTTDDGASAGGGAGSEAAVDGKDTEKSKKKRKKKKTATNGDNKDTGGAAAPPTTTSAVDAEGSAKRKNKKGGSGDKKRVRYATQAEIAAFGDDAPVYEHSLDPATLFNIVSHSATTTARRVLDYFAALTAAVPETIGVDSLGFDTTHWDADVHTLLTAASKAIAAVPASADTARFSITSTALSTAAAESDFGFHALTALTPPNYAVGEAVRFTPAAVDDRYVSDWAQFVGVPPKGVRVSRAARRRLAELAERGSDSDSEWSSRRRRRMGDSDSESDETESSSSSTFEAGGGRGGGLVDLRPYERKTRAARRRAAHRADSDDGRAESDYHPSMGHLRVFDTPSFASFAEDVVSAYFESRGWTWTVLTRTFTQPPSLHGVISRNYAA